jgi:hypothetical protein
LSQESGTLGRLSLGSQVGPCPSAQGLQWKQHPLGALSIHYLCTPAEGPPLSNTTFPHVLPLISLLECDSAPAEGPEPWGSTEHGVEVVLAHLEAARTVAHHGGLYHTNAEVKLQGEWWSHPEVPLSTLLPSSPSVCLHFSSFCPALSPSHLSLTPFFTYS